MATARPDEVYDDTLSLTIGGDRIELLHGRGETDDATFVWLRDRSSATCRIGPPCAGCRRSTKTLSLMNQGRSLDEILHAVSAPAVELAAELASLAGGAGKLAQRPAILAEDGRTRLAAHLAELAATAAANDKAIQATRASVLGRCRAREPSLIGKAIFAASQRDAKGAIRFLNPGSWRPKYQAANSSTQETVSLRA